MNEDSQRQARFTLAVLFAINMMNFFDRQILATVTEPIRKLWGLNDTQMGVMNTVFLLLYSAVGVPLGRLVDTGSRRKVLSICVALWSGFTALSGVAWSYWSLFVARLGVGIGEAGCSPASNSLIGDLFPASKRARATAVFMLGLPVGILLSGLLSGYIVERFTPVIGIERAWKLPFFIATIPGLLLALLALKIVEPMRGASEVIKVAATAQAASPFKSVLSIPTMWWLALSGALHNFNAYAVNAFMAAYLGRYHGLSLQRANVITAFTLGAVGIVGLLGGGALADWVAKRRANGRLLLGALAITLMTPCVYFAIAQPKGAMTPFVILMGLGWMLFYVYYVTVYPTVQDVVEPSLRGTAMAIYFFAMYVLGGALGTTALGLLSDTMARRAMFTAGTATMTEAARAEGLHNALFIVPLVAIALAFVLFMGARTVRGDMERLHARLRAAAES